jgi:hypothetical protein
MNEMHTLIVAYLHRRSEPGETAESGANYIVEGVRKHALRDADWSEDETLRESELQEFEAHVERLRQLLLRVP